MQRARALALLLLALLVQGLGGTRTEPSRCACHRRPAQGAGWGAGQARLWAARHPPQPMALPEKRWRRGAAHRLELDSRVWHVTSLQDLASLRPAHP